VGWGDRLADARGGFFFEVTTTRITARRALAARVQPLPSPLAELNGVQVSVSVPLRYKKD
jgi:hypothetical protein